MKLLLNLKTATILIISLCFFNCENDDDTLPPECDATNTPFNQLYNTTLTSNTSYDDYVFMDLLVHEYTFQVSNNQTICKVGYQGNANLYNANIPYTIEIEEVATSTIVYSGSHLFNPSTTDYQNITPTLIAANQDYIIRRIVTNFNGNIGTTIGRMVRFNLPSGSANPFPFSNSDISISSSNFYGTGGPNPNYGIPYIDIVFQ